LLLGPVGCGKSVANCLEIFRRGAQQEPADDGLRYSRWAVCRSTYPELKSTTIKTWLDWYPENVYGKIKYDSPICHSINVADMRLEVLFLPLANDDDLKKLKSLELTGIYFNELQFFSELLFEEAMERVNRYPPKKMGCKITWTGVISDTNPPDSQHWIYKRFEIQKPRNQSIYKYEPAVLVADHNFDCTKPHSISMDGTAYVNNNEADYVQNQQDPNYWLKLVENHNDDTIHVSYCGNYGIVRKNKRVYPEYNDKIHCVENIQYSPSSEIGFGWDFGRTPAIVIVQLSVHGHLMVLDEVCSEDMGLDEFCGDIVLPKLNRDYPGWKKSFASEGDPAGIAKNPTDNNCCFDTLRKHGILTRPAHRNAFTPRREAVSFFLRKMVGGRPCMMVSPKAIRVRQGFNGSYYYTRVQVHNDERYRDMPEKNEYSHPADALQYICLKYHSLYEKPKEILQNYEPITIS
jgi:hypothetical protein